MIKIAINSSPLTSGHAHRGIGVYTENLLLGLKKNKEIAIQEFNTIQEVNHADIVHYPYFDLFQNTLPYKKEFPTIVTIHDVTPLMFPEHYPPGLKGRVNLFLQKRSLQNIAAVITDSKSSQKDIEKKLSVPKEKISVTYLSASADFKVIADKERLEKLRQKYELPSTFALFTGNVNWNKNIVNLAQACIDAKVELVIVGKAFLNRDNLDHPELRSIKEFILKFANNPHIHILGFIETAELVGLVNLADVFLFPSFYEGFGIPVLEAQLCGTPVVTSNTSSLPEVAGEGSLYVDPSDVNGIAQAIKQVITDKALAKELVQKGFANAQKFSWEACAEQTAAVYKKVAGK